MLRNPPFVGNFPLSQSFGENPEFYKNVPCAGIPQLGHNGLDFATPPGTPVTAVQSGAVLESRSDPAGFGEFILLGHDWGQSLYAHLTQRQVQQGQQVAAGQTIGLSGRSGLVTGPHLHFGLRIFPFSVQDGWCGYCDPAPYLERLSRPRGAIIGPHIIGGVSQHLDLLRRWQPRMILVLDPNPDEMRALRQACPDTVIIGRVFEEDSTVDHRIRSSPAEAARWAHDKVMARMSPDVNYWQFANEVLQAGDGLPLLNQFELERMALAETAGYKCAILSFSVGNPDLPESDRMAMWRLVFPALERAERNGHVVALHQYGVPDLWGPNNAYDWYVHRLEHQVLRRLPYKKVQFAVTEYGIDGLIQGPRQGWQGFTSPEGYTDQLLKAGRYLERYSGRVLGYAVFTLGHNSPWGSYDIAGQVTNLLAERSGRGVWSQVNTDSSGIIAGQTDTTTDPGGAGEAPSPGGGAGTSPSQPGGGVPGGGTTQPTRVIVERRLSDRFQAHHMSIKTLKERPDSPGGDIVYIVKDVFTTLNGSWEPSGEAGAVPQWARDAYLRHEFLEAGADHHLFAAIIGLDGQLVKNHEVSYWSDGYAKLGDPGYTGYVRERTKESSGWANMFMAGGSSFAPDRQESGPWCWMPAGAAEVITGGGLPLNHHVSTYAVWQAVRRADWEASQGGAGEQPGGGQPGGEQPGGEQPGGGQPGGGQPGGQIPTVERRVGEWVVKFNLGIKSLAERPDNPQDEIVYLVKDVFTTRDGSWEPSSVPGSLPQWARDAYLKPFGAPDYFDDAGGDHHLFTAVIGLDGKLMRMKDVQYWSDGFAKLGDPGYTGYVMRQTKERSGWANIFTGPGSSFVPERGESGPWCWAPTGAAEVVCGGGMPANWHVSMFVVWQAVERQAAPGGGQTGGQQPGGGTSIFLPFISRGAAPAPQAAEMLETAVAPVLEASLLANLRRAAWTGLGIDSDPNSALAQYARQMGLGMPVTPELQIAGFRVQGFHAAIVYARGQDIGHVGW